MVLLSRDIFICLLSFEAVSRGRRGPGLSRQEVDPVSAKQWVNEERALGQPLVRGERQRSGVIHRGLAAERAMR